jgi:predicted CXXCH cytochrome family protein
MRRLGRAAIGRGRTSMLHSFLISLAVVAGLQAPAAVQPKHEDIDTCLACHGEKSMAVTLPSGESRGLFVDRVAFTTSVHGGKLGCTDCHTDITDVPHASKPFRTKREFTIAYYEACKRCHFANYSKTLDSVHYPAIARGDRMAPTCVDCHGAHDVTRPNQPRSHISQTCAACHQGVSAIYAKSVHGRALIDEKNADVPTCTDCHQSHAIAGPHAPGWRLKSPDLCATCHANAAMMKKYKLSTNVMQTYLADFHGMTASLQKQQDPSAAGGRVVALCIDCHGVHDISKTDAPHSSVMKANVVKTCQKCHPGASQSFSSAWLSHYEPTLKSAPLVYSVKIAYYILIPFMIGGLVLQILLHLWRVVVNR